MSSLSSCNSIKLLVFSENEIRLYAAVSVTGGLVGSIQLFAIGPIAAKVVAALLEDKYYLSEMLKKPRFLVTEKRVVK